MSIENKLNYLNSTKNLIKDAIVSKGVEITPTTPFRDYADKIKLIETSQQKGIRTKDGVLYIPKDTTVEIEDFESGSYTEYALPDELAISGLSGSQTLSDGQVVRYYADIEGYEYTYNTDVEYVNGSQVTEIITITSSSSSSGTRRNIGYPLKYPANSGIVRIPYAAFRIVSTDTDFIRGLNFYTSLSYFENKTYVKDIRIHDYGTEAPALWLNVSELVSANTDELIDPNDPVCNYRDYYINLYNNQYALIPNHYYVVYAIVDSSYNQYTHFMQDAIATCRWYGSGRKTISHYDEDLSVTLSGYMYSGRTDIQASISYYDREDKLGTTKINEQNQYYDAKPTKTKEVFVKDLVKTPAVVYASNTFAEAKDMFYSGVVPNYPRWQTYGLGYCSFVFPVKISLTGFKLTDWCDETITNRMCREFNIIGFNRFEDMLQNTNGTLVHNYVNDSPVKGTIHEVTITNAPRFKYYNIQSIRNGGDSYTSIGHIEFSA